MSGNKGVTLIALVITIVILIILAGVTINIAINEGIIAKAKAGAKESEDQIILEKTQLARGTMYASNTGEAVDTYQYKEELLKEFPNSTMGNGVVSLNNGKYDLMVINTEEVKVINYIENNELALIYEMLPGTTQKTNICRIEVFGIIGGVPTYEEYVRPLLEGISEEEKVGIFISKGYDVSYLQSIYPGETVDLNLLLRHYGCKTVEELLRKHWSCSTIEEALSSYTTFNIDEGNYNTQYNRNITITNPDGVENTVSLTGGGRIVYNVTQNGEYTFTANCGGQTVTRSITVNNIENKAEYAIDVNTNGEYEINSIEDLVALSENVNNGYAYNNKTIILKRTLDFNSDASYKNPNNTTYGDYNNDGITEGLKTEISKKRNKTNRRK